MVESILSIARARIEIPERTYYRRLGAYLAALREHAGIEQSAMADALNLSQSAYSRLETGDSRCKVDQLESAAKILKVSVASILKGTSDLESHQP